MNIQTFTTTVKKKIGSLFRSAKVYFQFPAFNNIQAIYPDIDAKRAIEYGFNKNLAVYAIVMKDARKFGSVTRYLYDKKLAEQKSKRLLNIPGETKAFPKIRATSNAIRNLTRLLNQPNPAMSQDKFYERVRCYYKIIGEAMIWLNRGDLEAYRLPNGELDHEAIDKLPVLEMYVLPADQIDIIPDPDNVFDIIGYKWNLTKPRYIRKNDVIHWSSTNMNFNETTREHMRGFSPLKPGGKTLESNNSMTDAMVRGAQNDGAKFVLYNESMNDMTPTQQTDLRAVIDSKINNNDVKGAVAVLQGKWGGVDLGKSSVDLQLFEGRQLSYKELCFLFDVPYEFFDSHTPFAEKQLTQIGWIINSIEPACKQLDGDLNRVLLKAFDLEDQAFIASDCAALPEMRKAALESAKLLQELWSISPNDVREFAGWERYDDPIMDVPWPPSSGRVPLGEMVENMKLENAAIESAKREINGNGI